MKSNLKFLTPLEAVEIINIIRSNIWSLENIHNNVHLQQFYPTLQQLCKGASKCNVKIDGFLGYRSKKIYKLKRDQTIDLLFKLDEMYRFIYKKLKEHNHELKRMVVYNNIQKILNWKLFDRRFPGVFEKHSLDFLFFSGNQSFSKNFPGWRIQINVEFFHRQLMRSHSTMHLLLAEFLIEFEQKCLRFTRIREDKFTANPVRTFTEILNNTK